MHFQISFSLCLLEFSELQVVRDWLCVKDMAETCLSRLLLLLILKSSRRNCSVEKGILNNFSGKQLSWSLILIK